MALSAAFVGYVWTLFDYCAAIVGPTLRHPARLVLLPSTVTAGKTASRCLESVSSESATHQAALTHHNYSHSQYERRSYDSWSIRGRQEYLQASCTYASFSDGSSYIGTQRSKQDRYSVTGMVYLDITKSTQQCQ